jgi:putative DNA primase/helicase
MIAALIDQLIKAAIPPAKPEQIIMDGGLHRFEVQGDRPGSRNGWIAGHLDPPVSAAFGSWKHGVNATWCEKSSGRLSQHDKAILHERMEADRRRRDLEQERRHQEAIDKTVKIWAASHTPDPAFSYLQKKRVAAGNALQTGDSLVLLVQDFDGNPHGLQFINPAGGKMFLRGTAKRGHFVLAAGTLPGRWLYIAEGFATGMTIASLATPDDCVIAALDAGNLEAVALAARQRWPELEIVICADADPVGVEKGRKAAIAARAKWVKPGLPPEAVAQGYTDFNDAIAWNRRQGMVA